jgi:hypothetical protein
LQIVLAKHNEILQFNLTKEDAEQQKDGETVPVSVKELGNCEIYPTSLSHNSNGRLGGPCNGPLRGNSFLFGFFTALFACAAMANTLCTPP